MLILKCFSLKLDVTGGRECKWEFAYISSSDSGVIYLEMYVHIHTTMVVNLPPVVEAK